MGLSLGREAAALEGLGLTSLTPREGVRTSGAHWVAGGLVLIVTGLAITLGGRPPAAAASGFLLLCLIGYCGTVHRQALDCLGAGGEMTLFIFLVAGTVLWSAAQAWTVSIDPSLSYDFIFSVLLLLVALPAGVVGLTTENPRFLLDLLLFSVSAVALFGLCNELFGWNSLGLTAKTEYLGWVTGTFVNRNAAADYFLIGTACAMAALRLPGPRLHRGLTVVGGLLCLAALLLSGSRAGIVLGLVAMVALAGMGRGGRRWMLAATGLAAPLAVLALLQRSESSVGSNIGRLGLWNDAMAAVGANPLLGSGAGTYPVVSVLFRSEGPPAGFTWVSSHNLYLDAAATLGVPATILVSVLLLLQVARLFSGAAGRHPVSLCAAVVATALLAHAVVDFSPSTPAVAVAAAILFGLAAGVRTRHARP